MTDSYCSNQRQADMAAPRLPRPVCEWLADQANAPPQEHGVPRGKPAEVSRTDPASAWSARTARGRFGYAFNVLIDTPGGVAIDVEASPARFAAEVDAGRTMLARADDRFGYRPKRVAADTAYGSAAFLAFVTDRGTMQTPLFKRSMRLRRGVERVFADAKGKRGLRLHVNVAFGLKGTFSKTNGQQDGRGVPSIDALSGTAWRSQSHRT